MKDGTPEKLVGALVNGLSILRYLRKAPGGVGVTQVARDLGLNQSTCFNLLRTLAHEGLVHFDPSNKTYALSVGIVSLAQGALDRENHIRMLHPELRRLAQKFGVAMNLWQVAGEDRVVLVDRAEPQAALHISMRIGQRLPMFVGSLGRCFAARADLPEAELKARFEKVRLARPISFADWLREVDATRAQGFAVDRGVFAAGITTVAVGLPDSFGRPFLAVSAIGVSEQLDNVWQSLAQDMITLARNVSQQN